MWWWILGGVGSVLAPLGIAVLTGASKIVLYTTLATLIASLAGNLIDVGIGLQAALLYPNIQDPGTLPVIQTIWTTFRDFINIFFILALLVIAFSTIFNIENYKASDLLPKLIIAALLINFSLVISVWVIKLLYIPTQVFLTPLTQGSTVSLKLANALRVQELFSPLLNEALNIPKFVSEAGIKLALLGVKAFLTVWIAFIIWARIVILMGLMIISPIAWLGLAIPAIRKQSWENWWNQLLTWGAITIPLFGLIYFVVLLNKILPQQIRQAAPTIGGSTLTSLGFSTLQFVSGLIILGVLFGGLMYIRSLTQQIYGWSRKGFEKVTFGPGKFATKKVGGLVGKKTIAAPEEMKYETKLVSDPNTYNPEIIASLTSVDIDKAAEEEQPKIKDDRIINLKNI